MGAIRATGFGVTREFTLGYDWQTKYYDRETQLYCFPKRYYDPRTGRWLSRDPLGEAGGFNLYAYCGNDPVNRHDPLGLESEVVGKTYVIINDQLKQYYVGESARDLFDKNGRFNDGQKFKNPHPAESLLKQKGTRVFSRDILATKGWSEGLDQRGFTEGRDQIKRAMESAEFNAISRQLKGYSALNKRAMMDPITVSTIREDFGARRSPVQMEVPYKVSGAFARMGGAPMFAAVGSPVRKKILSAASRGAVIYGMASQILSAEEGAEAAEEFEDQAFSMMTQYESGDMNHEMLTSLIKNFAAQQTGNMPAQHEVARKLEKLFGTGSGNVSDDIRAAIELY
jgi:RHS repeat-associated protein